jgi:hypothetical protein
MRSTLSVTGFWYFERVESGAGWGDRYKIQHNNFLSRLILLTVPVFLRIMVGYLESL